MQQIESRESKKIRRIYGIQKEMVITLIKEYANNTKNAEQLKKLQNLSIRNLTLHTLLKLLEF